VRILFATFSSMLGSLGDDLLTVAGLLALVAGIGGFIVPYVKGALPFRLVRASSVAVFFLLAGAFAILIAAYVKSDFSLLAVYQNSHTDKPLLYKVAAAWGNHEGSMILWTLIAALFGALLAWRPVITNNFSSRVLGVQALLVCSFIAFIVFTSDPFTLLVPAPTQGLGLNPVLQDPALAMHPPILYLGYVGFSLSFSFAVAGLLSANINKAWAAALRPYTLMAWSALTVGIALGSWWAYYELGWGGWWFWDPVENASFVPWLCATALIHALVVVEKRGSLKNWAVLLALLTFTLSLCGTFLVRSGAITSVHAFAIDPARGVFILLLIALTAGSGLAIFAARAHKIEPGRDYGALSRESLLTLNSLFFFTACATVFIGTVYPMALELFANVAISVGAPYYESTFVPLMIPMVLLMGFGPYMLWQRDEWKKIWPRMVRPALLAAALLLGVGVIAEPKGARFYIGIALAGWVFFASGYEWWLRKKASKNMVLRHHGMTLAHMGFAIALFGMVVSSHFSIEQIALLNPGKTLKLGENTLEFIDIDRAPGPNYTSEKAEMKLSNAHGTIAMLYPERRYYPTADKILSDVAIHTDGLVNYYVVLSEAQKNDKGKYTGWSVRAAVHPLAPWIWFGCVLMALGGIFAMPWKKRS
jgi:cytochrome c-type biogenesis protein CcmF